MGNRNRAGTQRVYQEVFGSDLAFREAGKCGGNVSLEVLHFGLKFQVLQAACFLVYDLHFFYLQEKQDWFQSCDYLSGLSEETM